MTDHPTTTPAALLERMRASAPLVHCITNGVVMNYTANALLAAGAAPAMVDIVGEAGPFAGIADGLLINLGTPAREQREAMREAVSVAQAAETPWVLDPVAIGALPIRTDLAHSLAEQGPAVIRGNASEVLALSSSGSGGRGVDATDSAEAAAEAAAALAQRTGSVVAVSGAADFITDGVDTVRVTGGSALLTRMTGGGCALGAVVAAFVGSRGDATVLDAAVAAHTFYAAAAERAEEQAQSPGSFAVAFIDALAAIGPGNLVR